MGGQLNLRRLSWPFDLSADSLPLLQPGRPCSVAPQAYWIDKGIQVWESRRGPAE